MNKEELRKILRKEAFRLDAYCLDGGMPDDQYVLAEEVQGILWCVYYSERGRQLKRSEFADENEACQELLSRLRRDPTTQS